MPESPTLLLVEDEHILRLGLEEALREGGFELLLADSGADALLFLKAQSQNLRGMITDVSLGPGPDGWEVARFARELLPDLPIVYMSGESAHEWTSHGVPYSTLVPKPFAPAQLTTAISALLNVVD